MKQYDFELAEKFLIAENDYATYIWTFRFTNDVILKSETLWRLYQGNKILLISEDNGQQFGLPEPINLSANLNNIISGKNISRIRIEDSGDMKLFFDDEITIEFLITSTGYENYELQINDKRYIASGSNNIVCIPE